MNALKAFPNGLYGCVCKIAENQCGLLSYWVQQFPLISKWCVLVICEQKLRPALRLHQKNMCKQAIKQTRKYFCTWYASHNNVIVELQNYEVPITSY